MPKFKQVTFELTKFILGTKAEENKKTEKNSLSLNFNTISDVLYPSASHPWMNFKNSKFVIP